MEGQQKTVAAYNKGATNYAKHYRGFGSRLDDIRLTFSLLPAQKDLNVLEIGCADGRDAAEILKFTDNYIGIDIAENFINLARYNVPKGQFEVADVRTYDFPKQLDVVFAFASLVHLNKTDFMDVLNRLHDVLNLAGLIYLSLKQAEQYEKRFKEDDFGSREFFFYNPGIIQEMIADRYEIVQQQKDSFTTDGNTQWFEMILRRKV